MGRPKTTDLQIRGFPVPLRERLRKRARSKGMSMSQYVIDKLSEDLRRLTWDEWLAELRKLPPTDLHGLTGADIIREAREEDDEDDARLWP
jgi:post-segregation antitoxin (ccd killing protein)